MQDQPKTAFVDMLEERRKDWDFLWAIRPMKPLLPHKLPPESKYTRKQTIEYILSKVTEVKHRIGELAEAEGISIKDAEKKARAILNEIASEEDLTTVRILGIFITKAMKRMFSKIYVNERMLIKLKQEMQLSQVQYVYVPSHRSYIDFILLSYVLFSYDMALPNIASGIDFYKMAIVGELLRKTGAFYMRRSFSKDMLYKEIFRSYINTIISHSDRAIEFFIEGTRSRSQKSLMPKYGLLTMILENLLQSDVPDIQFIPISVSYERPPEELLYVYEMLGIPKPKESTIGLLRSLSILLKPLSHGRIFFNICEPISARDYISSSLRKSRVLSPYVSLPTSVSQTIAHLIIDSQKKSTVLMPINIIASVLNERIQTNVMKKPYKFSSLVRDYKWFKDIVKTFGISMFPEIENSSDDNVEEEILESLRPHEGLIVLDSSNMLRLKQRHVISKESTISSTMFEGHTLSERTMLLAVPAINIALYINPLLSYLINGALIVMTIDNCGTTHDKAMERYILLRRLLSNEFAFAPIKKKDILKKEWTKSADILLRRHGLCYWNGLFFPGQDKKLFSLMYNIALPFVDVIQATCILFKRETFEGAGMRTFLAFMQKEVEKMILSGQSCCQHPYCLSLNLLKTTFYSLIEVGVIEMYPDQGKYLYRVNKIKLLDLIDMLRDLPYRYSQARYIDVMPSVILPSVDVQAKL